MSRNHDLLRDYARGIGGKALAVKYRITRTRVYQIIDRYGSK